MAKKLLAWNSANYAEIHFEAQRVGETSAICTKYFCVIFFPKQIKNLLGLEN